MLSRERSSRVQPTSGNSEHRIGQNGRSSVLPRLMAVGPRYSLSICKDAGTRSSDHFALFDRRKGRRGNRTLLQACGFQ